MEMDKKKKLLVFHTKVAPYRVDFFNELAIHYDMFMCMDRKVVYGRLYHDIEKCYAFDYVEDHMSRGIIQAYSYVLKYVKEKDPDIVMVSECGLISLLVVFIRWLFKKKYLIVSIIDDSFDQVTHGRQFSRRHVFAEKILIPHFHQIINVDERVSALFQRRYGKGVAFPIIRNEDIYRAGLFDCLSLSKEYIKDYGLENKKVVLFVGRFVGLKNISTLIRAYNKLEEKDVRLVLVGAGEEERALKALDVQSDIIFTGALSGSFLYAWYNIADVFVLPSLVETFGAVTNEALMAGCKCLISERAGSSCLIRKGVNGDCFNPLDEDELCGKLGQLLSECDRCNRPDDLRPNLMPVTFKQEMKKVLQTIDQIIHIS